MKTRTIAILGSVALALVMAVQPQQNAEAKKCYDQNKEEIPCPKSDYLLKQQAQQDATATDSPTPTDTPEPTATDTPKPTATNTPQAQSALGAPPANPGPADGAAGGSAAPAPPTQPTGFAFLPWLFVGGAFLLTGVLIGMLLPYISRALTGGLRGSSTDGSGGGAGNPAGWNWGKVDSFQKDRGGGAADAFYKEQDTGAAGAFPKVENSFTGDGNPVSSVREAAIKLNPNPSATGEAGIQEGNTHMKTENAADLPGSEAGWIK